MSQPETSAPAPTLSEQPFDRIGRWIAIAPLQLAGWVNVGQLVIIGAAWIWPDRRVQIGAVVLMALLTGWYAVTFIAVL